jgi:hypothetical protein
VRDFTFKIHDLAWDLERVMVTPHNDDDSDDGSLDSGDIGGLDGSSPDSNSDGGAPPVATNSA